VSEKKLLIATGNKHKAQEIEEILRKALPDFELKTVLASYFQEVREPEENGVTFLENALIKAHHYARSTGLLALADDSGLVIDALEGRPGVHSARYADTPQTRIDLVLKELEGIEPAQRTARFVCVAALADPGGNVTFCEGKIEGWISRTPRGEGGFGYDPIFVPASEITSPGEIDSARTLAQFTAQEKNSISHRGRAMERIAESIPLQVFR